MYWVTHNTFSILQTLLLKLPAFKRLANIPDPPIRDPSVPSKPSLGFMQAFRETREAFSGAVERTREQQDRKIAENDILKAEKARLKIREDRKLAAVSKITPPVKKANPVSFDNSDVRQQKQKTLATIESKQVNDVDAKVTRIANARRKREAQGLRKGGVSNRATM